MFFMHVFYFQLTNNMNGLEHIIKSETENLQDLTEDAVRHTEEMWTKVTETYNQLQDRGQDFLQSSSTVRIYSILQYKGGIIVLCHALGTTSLGTKYLHH